MFRKIMGLLFLIVGLLCVVIMGMLAASHPSTANLWPTVWAMVKWAGLALGCFVMAVLWLE